MTEEPDISAAWRQAEAQLPDGWVLDSLRCASTGLSRESRSDDWRAVATGPRGETADGEGSDPAGALAALLHRLT